MIDLISKLKLVFDDSPVSVKNVEMQDYLSQILTTLKKIEYHLYLASDTELKDQDV